LPCHSRIDKDKWIARERLHWAHLFSIPIAATVGPGFPPLTLQVQRVLAALQLSAPDSLLPALDVLYHVFWVEGNLDVSKPEVFRPVLERAVGEVIAERVIAEGEGEEAKKQLTENTDIAFKKGAFGLPWFECVNEEGEEEGFWGFDHLGQVVRFLGLSDGGQTAATGLIEGMKALL
jgi:2-hydroxychromene-2-carboxylate isomerase